MHLLSFNFFSIFSLCFVGHVGLDWILPFYLILFSYSPSLLFLLSFYFSFLGPTRFFFLPPTPFFLKKKSFTPIFFSPKSLVGPFFIIFSLLSSSLSFSFYFLFPYLYFLSYSSCSLSGPPFFFFFFFNLFFPFLLSCLSLLLPHHPWCDFCEFYFVTQWICQRGKKMRFASKNTRMHRELVQGGEKIKRIAYLFQSYSFYFELFYTN